MEASYKTPLARYARWLEIFIPGYMFGKSWGIANEETVDFFRAQFPTFLIDAAEGIKSAIHTENQNLERLFSTSAGALVGFAVIVLLAVIMHFVLGDRKYVDSLRFTAVTLIPMAVLNGTLSHAVKTLLENLGTQSEEALTRSALQSPWSYFVLNFIFYVIALWMFGRRTGVNRKRRIIVVLIGIGFVALYYKAGLMVTAEEWEVLLPKLQQSLAH